MHPPGEVPLQPREEDLHNKRPIKYKRPINWTSPPGNNYKWPINSEEGSYARLIDFNITEL